MGKGKKGVNRILSCILCITLILSGVMVPTAQVQAETMKKIAGLGVSVIKNPTAPTSVNDAWKGSYVYYGNYDADGDGKAEPVKYRVLDTGTTIYSEDGTTQTMLLDCDSVLYEQRFHEHNYSMEVSKWAESDIKSSLNGDDFLNKDGVFTVAEKNAIAPSKVAGHELTNDSANGVPVEEFCVGFFAYESLNGEQIFLLDVEDICNEAYGYGLQGSEICCVCREKTSRGAHSPFWWLRSTVIVEDAYNAAGYVDDVGYMFFEGHGEKPGASPAFNVNLSSVLFSSVVSGTAGETGAEYKLTLLDEGMSVEAGTLTKSGSTVTIPYTIKGANSANATQISVLILDREYTVGNTNDAKVLAYDKLDVESFSASGTGTFTIPESLYGQKSGEDYFAYIVAEDVNDAKETDYAGVPSEVTIPASLPVVGDDGFEYIVLEDGTIEVTGYKGTETELVIPNQIDGKPVTSIGECFAWGILNAEGVTAITIPDTVTRIKNAAFIGLGITSVTIPKGVTEINSEVFSGCENLNSVILPEGVTRIGSRAFGECFSLEGITIPDSVTSIENDAFYSCTSLKSITIPEGVTSIGVSAFQECSSLESVTIPESVKELGEWAFALCESLTSVTIPGGVTSIGGLAFAACSNLQSITISEGVTSIGEGAFYDCDGLTNVIIPEGLTSIGDDAFKDCSNLVSVEIPGTVTDIGENVFESCPEDMVVYVEAGSAAEEYVNDAGITTETIPAKDISGATGDVLTSYTYDGTEKTPKGTDLKVCYQGDVLDENVDYQILEYKNNLYAGTASVTLKGIGKYNGQLLVEFEVAKAAKPPVIPPESVRVAYSNQTVGACTLPEDWKWDEKDALEALKVEVPVKATACYVASDKDSYEQTSLVITITRSKCEHVWDAGTKTRPATIESTGEILYTCQICKETKVESVDKLTSVKKGDKRQDKEASANYIVTKVKGKKVEVAYAGVIKASNKVTIPNEVVLSDGTKAKVTSIAKKAFKNNKNIKTIIIGSNVKTIGEQAFYGCKKLTYVTIGKSVNKIGSKAFYGCSKLKKLTIKSTKLTKKKIGSKAFSKTPKKMSVKVPKKKFKTYKAMLIKKGVNKKAKFKKN